MKTVNTVLGPVSTDSLGFTLMHEHIITTAAGVTQDFPEILGDDFKEKVERGLKAGRAGGIDTVVDATTLDLGRDVTFLPDVSRKSGVNIIVCTGWWLEAPAFFTGVSADQLAGWFIREIREGISGTGVRAGILKGASDASGVTPWQETILRGVARAHHETDVPIMLHSYAPGRVAEKQIAILKEEGVDLRRVKVDHSNDTTDIKYLTWLLEQGCYLGMDRYPGSNLSPIERTRTLKALIDAGYADRLLPSHDGALAHILGDAPESVRFREEKERLNPYGYMYMKKVVLPQLAEMGVPSPVLDGLCITGPRNFFEGV